MNNNSVFKQIFKKININKRVLLPEIKIKYDKSMYPYLFWKYHENQNCIKFNNSFLRNKLLFKVLTLNQKKGKIRFQTQTQFIGNLRRFQN